MFKKYLYSSITALSLTHTAQAYELAKIDSAHPQAHPIAKLIANPVSREGIEGVKEGNKEKDEPVNEAEAVLTKHSTIRIPSDKRVKIEQKSSGKTLMVKVVRLENGLLTFQNNKGRTYTVALNKLTDASAKAAEEAIKQKKKNSATASDSEASLFKKVNQIIGQKLFGDSERLWDEKAADIAARLEWNLESLKANSSSYRLYTKMSYKFAGAHPYCVTLYGGKDDTPERFSLVFANKGDFGSNAGMGPDHFKKLHPKEKLPISLEEAIKLDEKLIAANLTEALGEAVIQYYGEKEDRRRVKRWDIKEHSFLLSALEGEYVYLLIVKKENANAQGRIKLIKDSDLKKLHLKNVIKSDNGDVIIDNIPMVDQGPKGYCAPATFERAMRYMQVPADMYLLATAATTQAGTYTSLLADNCKKIVRSKARKIKNINLQKDFKIEKLKKFIDKGVPVLWRMRSLSRYNKIATQRTNERKEITDMKAWSEKIQSEADSVKSSLLTNSNHHICMVIGYNEETNEVAVSDSWGPEFEIRWVHVDIAKAVTSNGGFVIDF